MAVNANILRENLLKRPSDRGLYVAVAVFFPLIVLIGYFKSYYFSAFFDVKPLANSLVHAHGIVMTLWVVYFAAQIALIRSKNVKLHMKVGMAGIALAAIVVVVGLATAYDAQLIRQSAPPGVDPHSFFILPVGDMLLFVIFFAAAIYYRKRPQEHKSLMLMTAINFAPAALFRVPIVPENFTIFFAFGTPALIAIVCLAWLKAKHGRLNNIFAAAIMLYIIGVPFRLVFAETAIWHSFTDWLVS